MAVETIFQENIHRHVQVIFVSFFPSDRFDSFFFVQSGFQLRRQDSLYTFVQITSKMDGKTIITSVGISFSVTSCRTLGSSESRIQTNMYAFVQCFTVIVNSSSWPPQFECMASFFEHRDTTSSSNLHHCRDT